MLKDQIEHLKEAARTNFLSTGSLLPVFISNMGNSFNIMPLFWGGPEDKEAFSKQLQHWISSGQLTEYIMISEAWALKRQKEDPLSNVTDWMRENGSLENHPDRGEVVMLQYCSPAEELDIFAEINRIDDVLELGDWQTNVREVKTSSVNPVDFVSRFNGMFVRSNAGLN
jgi:hypothetical protein